MIRCGLLGEKLGHSHSPAIHALLGDYEYKLYEKNAEEVADFLKTGGFHGLNVTIPYKKTAAALCDALSPEAAAIGSVNTLIRRPDGTLFGDNTDLYGFRCMVEAAGFDPAGKKCLVLGSGGASVTAQAVLRSLGGRVTVISRSGPDHYGNLDRHTDAALIVNTTPVGMYPGNGAAPLDLQRFPRLEAVLDLIYNPARTALLLQAEELGIPAFGGLRMLVAQAVRASELFTGAAHPAGTLDRVLRHMERATQNIVLIGMPGCGKSTLAAALAAATGKEALDSDGAIEAAAGRPIPAIFSEEGEPAFRQMESAAIEALSARTGVILATGGGAVLRPENVRALRQNGILFWLQRDLDRLPTDGRPLSRQNALSALYAAREPLYRAAADHIIHNNGTVGETLRAILEVLQ